jgi:hypothetical protein
MNSTSVLFTWTCHLLSHHACTFAFCKTEGTSVIQSHLYSFIQVEIILWQLCLNVYFIFYDLCECLILRCYAYEGMSFVTFVRDALYPEGIYRYEGRRTLTLNIFRVALFLILSIWEQVPNTYQFQGGYLHLHILLFQSSSCSLYNYMDNTEGSDILNRGAVSNHAKRTFSRYLNF